MELLIFFNIVYLLFGIYTFVKSILKLEIFSDDSRSRPKIGRFGRNLVRLFFASIGVYIIIHALKPWMK